MRVWAVSDVHTDYKENMAWCESIPDEYQSDCVILAGDVSDNLEIFKATLRCFTRKWKHVFFVPGNHDLWTTREERGKRTSLEKLVLLQQICTDLGVHTIPQCLEGVWIVPLYSWYHASFDQEPDVPGAIPANKLMMDFQACTWPEPLNGTDMSLAAHFDQMNQEPVADVVAALDACSGNSDDRTPVITFSHFLPLQDLLPEKRMLYQANLAKAVGSQLLAKRIQQLRPVAHVFGHTHFNWDSTIDGVRYIQRPLAYPKERRRLGTGHDWQPALVYDTACGLSPQRRPYWSSYYADHARKANIVQPAPWVL